MPLSWIVEWNSTPWSLPTSRPSSRSVSKFSDKGEIVGHMDTMSFMPNPSSSVSIALGSGYSTGSNL